MKRMKKNWRIYVTKKYIELQSKHIKERIKQFDNKLYLELVVNYLMTTMHLVFYLDLNQIVN